jgi:hypothetical protein
MAAALKARRLGEPDVAPRTVPPPLLSLQLRTCAEACDIDAVDIQDVVGACDKVSLDTDV